MPKKPTFLPPEQVKRIAKEGREKRKARGEVIDMRGPIAGGRRPRAERIKVRELAADAGTYLALGDLAAWYEATRELASLCKGMNYGRQEFTDLCTGIEASAISVSGNKQIPTLCADYLRKQREQRLARQ